MKKFESKVYWKLFSAGTKDRNEDAFLCGVFCVVQKRNINLLLNLKNPINLITALHTFIFFYIQETKTVPNKLKILRFTNP